MAYELLSQSRELDKREGVGWGMRCGGCPNKSVAGTVSLKKKKQGWGGAYQGSESKITLTLSIRL